MTQSFAAPSRNWCCAIADERCGGEFDEIDAVIPAEERAAFMAGYKAAAGFAIEALNGAPPTIRPGDRAAAGGAGW
jgi:hypothetical protein